MIVADETAPIDPEPASASIVSARETALSEVLRVISISRDDEAPVFEVILRNAARLCDAPFAGLYLVDGARREAVLVSSLGARSAYRARDDALVAR